MERPGCSLAVPAQHDLLVRSDNLVGSAALRISLQPAGAAEALLAPGCGIHAASAWCALYRDSAPSRASVLASSGKLMSLVLNAFAAYR